MSSNTAPSEPGIALRGRTRAEKVWDDHLVKKGEDGAPDLLYIDLHLVHEVTSPQAFDGLRVAGRKVRQPKRTIATIDHNVPTTPKHLPVLDQIAGKQMEVLRRNCAEFAVELFDVDSPEQGIVH